MELEKVSPTDVEGFDPRTTFGCPSKFHFKTVQGIPEPGNVATALGDDCHSQVEHTLVTGQNALSKITEPGLWFLEKVQPYVAVFEIAKYTGLKFKHEAEGYGLGIELKFGKGAGYELEGLPATGRIDLLLDYGRARADAPLVRQVHDHKTSSNVAAYGKTENDLLTNHQTSIYLDFCRFKFGWGKSENEMLRMSHGYFQTKGKKLFKPVETFVSIPQLDAQIADTRKVIRSMKDVAHEGDIRKVDKNLRACDVGHGCPYKTRCPRGVSAMNNLLSRFKKPTAAPAPAAPPPAPAAPPKPAAPPPPAVKAPDAPASNPAIAAQPPKGPKHPQMKIQDVVPPQPTPEELEALMQEANEPTPEVSDAPQAAAVAAATAKRGPGRPPKAEAPVRLKVTSLSLRHGLTVNLGDRNFAKVEVEVTGESSVLSKEELSKELGEFARAEVDKQLSDYAAQMDQAAAPA